MRRFYDFIVTCLISAMLVPRMVWAQPAPPKPWAAPKEVTGVREGDQPKNMQVIPPWTIRLCGISPGSTSGFYATYAPMEALELKKIDADCALWRDAYPKLKEQIESYKLLEKSYKEIVANDKVRTTLDNKRITDLVKQLKEEIAEKNKYKYQPTYGWVWAVVGGGVALVATGFAVGFGVAYAKK